MDSSVATLLQNDNSKRRSSHKKLPRKFYERDTLIVVRELLGKILVRKYKGKTLSGRIVEVEAYRGLHDAASHTHKGKTKRNEVMFASGGHLYVYFTYGMHFCANVVTEGEGIGHACLIRALEPIEGIETMKKLRGIDNPIELTNGPAKLCEALGIGRAENGTDLLGDEIFLLDAPKIASSCIGKTARIGITRATEFPYRFFIKRNPYISKGKPSV
ncbi:MAG TPA: DNA-3-methyladenine glycosylase [Candidatus Kapabacteria bacterium]|nr:DNA-3-methyladenine glycosylase [Candidatus Kapabacteria bacterium]